MTQQRRQERRLGVGRRLLLVLAVVAGAAFPAVHGEHGGDDDEAGNESQEQDVHGIQPRVLLGVLDPVVISLIGGGVRGLLRKDLPETVPAHDLHAFRRGEGGPGDQRAELHELPGRDVQRAQDRAPTGELHVAAHVHGVSPGAADVPGCDEHGGEPSEGFLPLVAPHSEVDVDDVVVGDGEAPNDVADLECPHLVGRVVVPDDAHAPAEISDPVRPRRIDTAELRTATGPVHRAAFRDRDIRDRLARA